MSDALYAVPRTNVRQEDCWFYHTVDLPGTGVIEGHWDLRGMTGQYLGNIELTRKRVLEIGPANGFVTAYMEQQGADVVAVEQPESAVWDFVPYHIRDDKHWNSLIMRKRRVNEQVKNAFWLTHQSLELRSKVHYGKVAELPEGLGMFDVSVIALVLTHMRDPFAAIIECAKRTREKLVIVERTHVENELQEKPLMQLIPDRDNNSYGSWWYFSDRFFTQLCEVMGFRDITVSKCHPLVHGKPYPVTTFVASW